jgi:hypothetical protein
MRVHRNWTIAGVFATVVVAVVLAGSPTALARHNAVELATTGAAVSHEYGYNRLENAIR